MPGDRKPKKRKAGWFVELDKVLKDEFKAYYPTRSAMRQITVRAVEQAVRYAKEHNLPRYDAPASKPTES